MTYKEIDEAHQKMVREHMARVMRPTVEIYREEYERIMGQHEDMRKAIKDIDDATNYRSIPHPELDERTVNSRFYHQINEALHDLWHKHGSFWR